MLTAFVVAALCALPIFRLLLKLKSRQTVSQHVPEHAGKQGTPTMGGLIVGVGFLAGIASIFAIIPSWLTKAVPLRYFGAFIVLYVVFAVIGYVDDYVVPKKMVGKRGLGWSQKLVMQFVAAWLFAAVAGAPIPAGELAAGILIILFFSNAYNFSDGLDALAGSLLIAMSLGFGWIALMQDRLDLLAPLAALVGGVLPFLWLNRPPAKVFMGDVGSLPIGATLGVVVASIALPSWHPYADPGHFYQGATWPVVLGLLIVSFVMFAELVPVPLQILSVKLRKKRLFPMTPIHHAYQKAGWKEFDVVKLFVGVQIACSLIGPLVAIFLTRGQEEAEDNSEPLAVFRSGAPRS